MTAVASPPSVQSGPRLGWYPSSNGGQGSLTSPGAEEVSRMFMPRKSLQRTNSSSSLASSTSSTSTISANSQNGNAGQTSNNENGSGPAKKKPYRYIWSSSKAEPVSGVTNARSQAVSAPPSSTTASSAMSALHQPSQIVPSQHSLQSQQQNGIRQANGGPPNESPAVLVLSPINGTFERKQITVPYFPEVLRVGRQTNAKTVPTPLNGYFDSKVLSRQHAEVWADRSGKVWIRDVKSSNGTFVNGQRLSPENRDSEPHELREQDVLELGIDIVSEDQRSIVHHKVSAKVDHAGIYGHNMNVNVLDLNFGDIDPTAGGGMLPSHLSQPLPHMRGRSGSSGSIGSNRSAQSASSTHLNALHQQRQMNYWLSPISIEQVVKKLSAEMKQAKQQSQDLNQTQHFLTSLISQDGPEKERPKASPTDSHGGRLPNGRPKIPKLDPMARFSDPPAPPPQQPLPEKPHALPRSTTSDSIITSPLKRSDTEKPKAPSGSPVSRDSGQILSLLEALATARKELDAQATRVKELEGLLAQERTARENAEERARGLEGQPSLSGPGPEVEEAFEPPADANESAISDENTVVEETAPTPDVSRAQSVPESSDSASEHLQRRLDAVMAEMDEMRKQVDKYKHSAERAEKDAAESRKTLAEMIETIRRERSEAAATLPQKTRKPELEDSANERDSLVGQATLDPNASSTLSPSSPHILSRSQFKELEGAATAFAKQRHKHHLLEQSAPYASMLGVVLLGVGIMAYLNGWQKIDK